MQFNSISACWEIWEHFFGVLPAAATHGCRGSSRSCPAGVSRYWVSDQTVPRTASTGVSTGKRQGGRVGAWGKLPKGCLEIDKVLLVSQNHPKNDSQKNDFYNLPVFSTCATKTTGTCTCPPSLPPKTWIVPAMVAAATYARPGQASKVGSGKGSHVLHHMKKLKKHTNYNRLC